jgi:hypothetical protein
MLYAESTISVNRFYQFYLEAARQQGKVIRLNGI